MRRLHKTDMDKLLVSALSNYMFNCSNTKSKNFTVNKADPTSVQRTECIIHMVYGFEADPYGGPMSGEYKIETIESWGTHITVTDNKTHKSMLDAYWDSDDGWCLLKSRSPLQHTRKVLSKILTEGIYGELLDYVEDYGCPNPGDCTP